MSQINTDNKDGRFVAKHRKSRSKTAKKQAKTRTFAYYDKPFGKKPRTVTELAEALNLERRTIYRYIENIQDSGYILIKEKSRYYIVTEKPTDKNAYNTIRLTPQETLTLNYLLQNLSSTNPIKEELRQKFNKPMRTVPQADCTSDEKNAPNMQAITQAIQQHRQAIFRGYASSNSSAVRDRIVEPFGFTTNYVDVWCFDTEDRTNKRFKIQRIQSVDILQKPWEFGNNHRRGFVDVFRMHGFAEHPVKLRLGVLAHNLLVEEYPLAAADTYRIDDGHWLLETAVADFRGVARFVIGLADDIQIIDTPELSLYIRDFLNKYTSKL